MSMCTKFSEVVTLFCFVLFILLFHVRLATINLLEAHQSFFIHFCILFNDAPVGQTTGRIVNTE